MILVLWPEVQSYVLEHGEIIVVLFTRPVSTLEWRVHSLIDLLLLFFSIFLLDHRLVLLHHSGAALKRSQLNAQHVARGLSKTALRPARRDVTNPRAHIAVVERLGNRVAICGASAGVIASALREHTIFVFVLSQLMIICSL